MDPKNIPQNLDPKLKEVYERVMGTPVGGTSSQPPPTPPNGAPKQPLPPQTQPKPAGPLPPPPSPIPPPPLPQTSVPQNSKPFPVVNLPAAAPKQEAAASVPQKKSHLTIVIFAIVGLVFFAVYALFWMRFFNLPVPFLPQ